MITLGSLFDGIAGFPLAGQRNGITAKWASEIEPFPMKVSAIRFLDMVQHGDITKINGAEVEIVDIITGGSPCQDLSVAGKRAGLAGERSGLFMEQIRIVREMRNADNGKTGEFIRPRFMVWENVPGAFSSNKGEDFRAVLEETARIADETITIPRPPKDKWNTSGCIMGNGYSIAWRILDAQYWGVPQRRRRIFLAADFGGQSAPEVLFKRKGLSRHIEKGRETREGIAADVERSFRETGPGYWGEGIGCLRAEGENRPSRPSNIIVNQVIPINDKATRHMGGGQSRNHDGSGNGLGIGKPGDPCPTLTQGDKHAVACIEPGALSRVQGERVWDKCPTLRAEMGDNHPCVITCASKQQAQSIGYDIASTIGADDYKEPQIVAQINCQPSGIAGTVSSKWAKGTGGPAGDEHYNLVIDEVANCLKAKTNLSYRLDSDTVAKTGYSVRRLTPTECERLQDYPDGWTDIPGASDSGRYKALGNSVAVCCPEYVLEGIADILNAL